MKNKKNKIIYEISILAVFSALIVVMTFTSIGYIPLGITQLTIIHIIVAIGAMLLGKKDGAILGCVWGIFSFIYAIMNSGILTNLIFVFPWVSILPRTAVGWLYGFIYEKIKNITKKSFVGALVSSISTTIIHTLLVYVFFMPTLLIYSSDYTITSTMEGTIANNPINGNICLIFLAIFGFNCLFETASCALVTGVVIPIISNTSIVNNYLSHLKDDKKNKGDVKDDKKNKGDVKDDIAN